mmetsp:Transcript_16497/g.33425  ORF Transcript_16497/g.33425 Transcript_16497/m.33425 type:complete len:539 (-) Transcript_16497:324-1940(-)
MQTRCSPQVKSTTYYQSEFDRKKDKAIHKWSVRQAVHEFRMVTREGRDSVVLDSSGSDYVWLTSRMIRAYEKGYYVVLLYVRIPVEVAVTRNRSRMRRAMSSKIVPSGLHWVPEEVIWRKSAYIDDSYDRARRCADEAEIIHNCSDAERQDASREIHESGGFPDYYERPRDQSMEDRFLDPRDSGGRGHSRSHSRSRYKRDSGHSRCSSSSASNVRRVRNPERNEMRHSKRGRSTDHRDARRSSSSETRRNRRGKGSDHRRRFDARAQHRRVVQGGDSNARCEYRSHGRPKRLNRRYERKATEADFASTQRSHERMPNISGEFQVVARCADEAEIITNCSGAERQDFPGEMQEGGGFSDDNERLDRPIEGRLLDPRDAGGRRHLRSHNRSRYRRENEHPKRSYSASNAPRIQYSKQIEVRQNIRDARQPRSRATQRDIRDRFPDHHARCSDARTVRPRPAQSWRSNARCEDRCYRKSSVDRQHERKATEAETTSTQRRSPSHEYTSPSVTGDFRVEEKESYSHKRTRYELPRSRSPYN